MRQILILSVLLLGGMWAAAQTSSQSYPSSSGQTSSHASTSSTGSHKTVEGCLSESNGKYMLKDKQGMTYELSGDTSKLAEHVGHEVKVTGSESAESGTATSSMSHEKMIEVTSVKHVSKSCEGGGMAK